MAEGYVDIADDLALQILSGLEFGHEPRAFTVISDAIPHGAKVTRTTLLSERPGVVRICFEHSEAEARQYTPTLETKHPAMSLTDSEFALLKEVFLCSGGSDIGCGISCAKKAEQLMDAISARTGIGFEQYT